jgi:hypothetical protein
MLKMDDPGRKAGGGRKVEDGIAEKRARRWQRLDKG